MKPHATATSLTVLLLVIAGCAGSPPAPVPTGKVATAPATQAPLGPTVVPTTDADTLATARRLGYVPRVHNGTVVYCRTEAALGTRFESTSCISQDQVMAAAQRTTGNQASLEDEQRHSLNQQGGDSPGR
jgi:hypothetical protein